MEKPRFSYDVFYNERGEKMLHKMEKGNSIETSLMVNVPTTPRIDRYLRDQSQFIHLVGQVAQW